MPSFTLTVATAQAARIAVAFGTYWHLTNPDGTARNATAAEVKEYLIRQLSAVVRQQERHQAEQAVAEPTALTVT